MPPAAVSKTCLVLFDNNKYSVVPKAVGRQVDVQAYADRIVIRQDGEIVAEHPRRFGRDQTSAGCDDLCLSVADRVLALMMLTHVVPI